MKYRLLVSEKHGTAWLDDGTRRISPVAENTPDNRHKLDVLGFRLDVAEEMKIRLLHQQDAINMYRDEIERLAKQVDEQTVTTQRKQSLQPKIYRKS